MTCPSGGIPAYSDFGGVAAVLVCHCIRDEVLDAVVVDVGLDIIGECIQWSNEAIFHQVLVTIGNFFCFMWRPMLQLLKQFSISQVHSVFVGVYLLIIVVTKRESTHIVAGLGCGWFDKLDA